MLIVKATALALAAVICLWGTFAHAQGKYDGVWEGALSVTCHGETELFHSDEVLIVGGSIDALFATSRYQYQLRGSVFGNGRVNTIKVWAVRNSVGGHVSFTAKRGNLNSLPAKIIFTDQHCLLSLTLSKLSDVGDEGEAYEEYEEEDFESGRVEELEDDIGKYLRKPPTEKEVQEMDNFILCRLGEIYEIPFVVTEIKKRYLKCDKLLQMFQEEPEEDIEFEY